MVVGGWWLILLVLFIRYKDVPKRRSGDISMKNLSIILLKINFFNYFVIQHIHGKSRESFLDIRGSPRIALCNAFSRVWQQMVVLFCFICMCLFIWFHLDQLLACFLFVLQSVVTLHFRRRRGDRRVAQVLRTTMMKWRPWKKSQHCTNPYGRPSNLRRPCAPVVSALAPRNAAMTSAISSSWKCWAKAVLER